MNIEKITEYLEKCRWCNFKEDIKKGHVCDLTLDKMPYDDGKKIFVIGEVLLKDDVKRYFSMPLAIQDKMPDPKSKVEALVMDGTIYTDALLEPDFWQSFMSLVDENNGKVQFPNGWTLVRNDIDQAWRIDDAKGETSKALGVEQSNTTLNVGRGKLAFKLERMLEFSSEVNSELEMNEKLMRENCNVMPKSYGSFIWQRPDGTTASSGIVQEFVNNKGDMWKYLLDYMQPRLQDAYVHQKPLKLENEPEFVGLLTTLNHRTQEMSECFARPDNHPHFSPEKVDENFIRHYEKQFNVLIYQAKRNIVNNLDKLPIDTQRQAEKILKTWDESTTLFLSEHLNRIRLLTDKGTLHRVHGDFHLGQVMVTPDNDLRFIDFAGEPGLSMKERQQKHLSVRDVAGMYRSIQGYLGEAAVEQFALTSKDPIDVSAKQSWASKAIKPFIADAAQTFLGDKTLQNDPWLALEVLRKNFYEIDYELNNRPQMAYIPINGLTELLGKEKLVPANENILPNTKFGNDGK